MFAVVGLVGALLLVLFLVFDDALEGILPDVDWISGPVCGAFLAAFGLFGWVAQEGFDAPAPVAIAAGVAGGIGLGWFAYRLSRALLHGPTDETPRTATLIGKEGRVVTAVSAGRLGEIVVRLGGQPVKLAATAAETLAVGTAVVVIAVESDTKVVVEAAARFWGQELPSAPSTEPSTQPPTQPPTERK
jgi:membrane protein implicated in regulation of membrane protease activity